ncbi:hypothetical protein [Clavibacter michiganensis]|uniref:hypothetical protein n=1 Tax=Clavibacter michiganensis TaxID=28447 RepID=UPI001F4D431A|nr:hypothetical protein [Clavibacter michiganensis]
MISVPAAPAPAVPAPAAPEERADAATVARAEARGELVRLRAGVHVERRAWEAVSARERHLLRIRALARISATPLVLGGASAAAVHDLPRIAPWPTLVTLLALADAPPGRRAGTRIVRDPAQGRSRLVPVAHGIRAPGLAAAALAASHDAAMEAVRSAAPRAPGWFAHGLVALDSALAAGRPVRATRSDLEAERALRGPGPWSRRSEMLVAAADGAASSTMESVARGVAHEAGLPVPAIAPHVPGHGRLSLAWLRERVALRIPGRTCRVTPPGGDGGLAMADSEGGGRSWRVVEVAERDVLGAGRLRALLLHAGLEPERRSAYAAGPGAHPPAGGDRPRRRPPLGCGGE